MTTPLPWTTKLADLISEEDMVDLSVLLKIDVGYLKTWLAYAAFRECVQGIDKGNRAQLEPWVDFFLKHIPVRSSNDGSQEFFDSPLGKALDKGDIRVLKKILKAQPDTNWGGYLAVQNLFYRQPNPFTQTRIAMFDLLLQNGLVLTERIMVNLGGKCWRCVELMLDQGYPATALDVEADSNLLMAILNDPRLGHVLRSKQTPLSLPQLKERVDFFLDAGIDINHQDEDGWSAFYYAALTRPDILPYLIEKGANPVLRLPDDSSFLHEVMVSRTVPHLPSDYGLINEVDEKGETALHRLVLRVWGVMFSDGLSEEEKKDGIEHCIDAAQWLVDQGLDIHIKSRKKICGWQPFVKAAPFTMQFWLDQGADVLAPMEEESFYAYLSGESQGHVALEVLVNAGYPIKETDFTDQHWEAMPPPVRAWVENHLLQTQVLPSVEKISSRLRRL